MNNNDIQVSVCIVTYNQENYIAECLEGIVTQQTNFKFEVIVGEDCSTDNTRLIIQEYIEKYPELIIPVFHEKNVGAVENIKQVYKKAKGKYIAHIDGDDLVLPDKLQKQFDILEANPDCNICTHDVIRIEKNGKLKNKNLSHPQGKYGVFDLYKRMPFFSHSSKMFINKYSSEFWDKLLCEDYILDIDIHVANLEDGHIFHMSNVLGAYRVKSGISFKDLKVNKILPLGVERIFEKGLDLFKHDEDKLEEIKKLYALSMLKCAYSYAIYDKDAKLFNLYVRKSIEQKNIGLTQSLFKLATFSPRSSFVIFSIISKFRAS